MIKLFPLGWMAKIIECGSAGVQAFELAWANTNVFGRCRPHCRHMDDIWFRQPVEVGSMLYYNSQICYTQDHYVQTRVSAEVRFAAVPVIFAAPLTPFYPLTFISFLLRD
jgi:hypothetical protein